MSEPKTLLAMAGADPNPPVLSDAVVVMIDFQNEYLSGALPLPGGAAALAEGAKLLERARAANAPIIHIAHAGQPGGPFDRAAERGAISDAVAPAGGETVIEKSLPNAFAKTSLVEMLQEHGRKEIIFAGFMTHMCVSSSVRAALDLDYRATIVAGACATRDLPAATGGKPITADALHDASLAALADRFAVIAKDAEVFG